MRFRLTLAVDRSLGKDCVLPINYQYEISSWIYHTIHHGNPEFSKWLHENGLTNQNRKFKLFTFSGIRPALYKVSGDRLEIASDIAEIFLSFYLPEAVSHFITGLFKDVHFSIGDRISAGAFNVSQVEKLVEAKIAETMMFSCTSPIVVSKNDENGSRYARYVSPEEPDYETLFLNNLTNKYIALVSAGIIPSAEGREAADMSFRCMGKPRQKLIRIKSGTDSEISVRGYLFNFELTAPMELMRIGYYGGFGEKNSLGFGCCE